MSGAASDIEQQGEQDEQPCGAAAAAGPSQQHQQH